MMRPLPERLPPLAIPVVLLALGGFAGPSRGDEPPQPTRGQFFTITEPITSEVITRVRTQAQQYVARVTKEGVRPILFFEIRREPGVEPSQTDFGMAQTLAEFLSTKLTGAQQTVAFVPEPLSGYTVLVALACDEIVMAPEAAIGPITPPDQEVDPLAREYVRMLARRKGRDADLLVGMLDRDADLRKVTTADRQTHYVLAENMAEFRKRHQIVNDQPAWEGGQRGIMTGQRARSEGLCKRNAESRAEIRTLYNLKTTEDDPTLDKIKNPLWIKIDGPLDTIKEQYLRREIARARVDGVNLIFFQINSQGGLDKPADNLADMIAGIKDMKTVAYIDDRAMGVAALLPLACSEIVFRKGSTMGEVRQIITGRGDHVENLSESQIDALSRRAEDLAKLKGHPPAIARAMVDPEITLLEAKDSHTGAVVYITDIQMQSEPGRYLEPEIRKEPGQVLGLTADEALSYGLASEVVTDAEQLKALYGIKGPIRVDGPTWVDAVVTTLNTDWMSWLLLFIGFFMLVLELKVPGIGLPAITSALAFLLFFWSRYLSGTADQLEILLFVVGLICLALELFVFPGFGVFGMSGILLILISVVMASHTFVWPTQDYEYREMGQSLLQVTLVLVAVAAGAVLVGRYFPSLPLFNRMVLKPEPAGSSEPVDPTAKPAPDPDAPLHFLVGEVGRTTTVLRPTGKALFGDLLVDVTSDGFYIEPDSLVEVVEVQGTRVIVKRV
jgi:membrane-bound serine protease (ClpP class)